MKQSKFEMAKQLILSERLKVDTENGTVLSKRRNGEYKQATHLTKTTYPMIVVSVNGKQNTFYVHQLVMIASNENIVNIEINHINGNKLDNRYVNLEKSNRSKNISHAWKMKRDKCGL